MALKKKSPKKKPAKKAVKRAVKKPAKKVVKKAAKKVLKKKPAAARKPVPKKPKESEIGIVTHYFPHVQAAVIKLKAPLSVGDTIKIKGHTTDLTESVNSMQMDHLPIVSAKKGQEIGLKVESRVRQHDKVYKA